MENLNVESVDVEPIMQKEESMDLNTNSKKVDSVQFESDEMETTTRKALKLGVIACAWIGMAIIRAVHPFGRGGGILGETIVSALIVNIPLMIYGRTAKGLVRRVWNICETGLDGIMKFDPGSVLVGALAFMFGILLMSFVGGVWSLWIFVKTLYQLVISAQSRTTSCVQEESNGSNETSNSAIDDSNTVYID